VKTMRIARWHGIVRWGRDSAEDELETNWNV